MQRRDSGYIEDGAAKQEEEEKPQRRVKDMLKEDMRVLISAWGFFVVCFLGGGKGGSVCRIEWN